MGNRKTSQLHQLRQGRRKRKLAPLRALVRQRLGDIHCGTGRIPYPSRVPRPAFLRVAIHHRDFAEVTLAGDWHWEGGFGGGLPGRRDDVTRSQCQDGSRRGVEITRVLGGCGCKTSSSRSLLVAVLPWALPRGNRLGEELIYNLPYLHSQSICRRILCLLCAWPLASTPDQAHETTTKTSGKVDTGSARAPRDPHAITCSFQGRAQPPLHPREVRSLVASSPERNFPLPR